MRDAHAPRTAFTLKQGLTVCRAQAECVATICFSLHTYASILGTQPTTSQRPVSQWNSVVLHPIPVLLAPPTTLYGLWAISLRIIRIYFLLGHPRALWCDWGHVIEYLN